jgi:hypothetical protein
MPEKRRNDMTVGSSTVTTLVAGRENDAIADAAKFRALLERHGAQNYRVMLMMDRTPLRMVTSYEAEDQAALGKVADNLLGDPEFQPLMEASFGPGGNCTGYVTQAWIEL